MASKESQLTYEDLTTIISRFSSSIHKLKASGDYPEKAKDKRILRKLIDMQWEERRKENERFKKNLPKMQ